MDSQDHVGSFRTVNSNNCKSDQEDRLHIRRNMDKEFDKGDVLSLRSDNFLGGSWWK